VIKVVAIVVIVFAFGTKSVYSATDNISISVGGMSWYSIYNPISRIGGKDVPNTSSAFMNGLTMKAQYKNIYFGATYLISSNNYELVVTDHPLKIRHAAANSSASRNDIDFVVGYMLTPILSLNTGYKDTFVDDNIALTSQGVTENAKRSEMYNLGKLGVGANIPIGTKFIWFLNGNALLGAYHDEVSYPANYKRLYTPDTNVTAWGASAETNLKYKILDHLSATAGLYCQYTKAGGDNSSFFGPTLGFDYTF
jgi:hypothetical protein